MAVMDNNQQIICQRYKVKKINKSQLEKYYWWLRIVAYQEKSNSYPNFAGSVQDAIKFPGSQTTIFHEKQTWPAVKCWPIGIISIYIQEYNNLGGQPCNFFAGNAQNVKI